MSTPFQLKLYNTESRQKEEVYPMDGKVLRAYFCGPTIYDFAHIGNLRTYIFEDLLRKTLEFFDQPIKVVMNITDVDDKTIKRATEKKISLKEYTKPYLDAFFNDLKALNIKPADEYPEATGYIDKMIEMIQQLIDKGFAYLAKDGNVYFSIQKFPAYGKLSHLKMDELKQGASKKQALDEYDKEQVSDFVLWKKYNPERDGKIFWESPFGKGRPGWHIECSTMAIQLLGKTIDIHCGGVDNIFPHHENEIAQSESLTQRRFSHLWVHAEHLIVEGKKMSKSLGNFYTLRDLFEKGYTGPQVRYMLMHTHYRMQLNFTFDALDGICSSLERIKVFILRMKGLSGDTICERTDSLISESLEKFCSSLADDLNISVSLATVFDLIRSMNQLADEKHLGKEDAKKVLEFFQKIDQVLGFLPLDEEKMEIPKEIQEALEKREQARKEKNWALADEMRDFIQKQGFIIEDSPEGMRVKKS